MPSASELARLEAEDQQEDGNEQASKALAYDTLVARAKSLGCESVTAALDELESLRDDR